MKTNNSPYRLIEKIIRKTLNYMPLEPDNPSFPEFLNIYF